MTGNSHRSYWTIGEIDSAGKLHSSSNNYAFAKAGTYKLYFGSINNRGNLFFYIDGRNTFEWSFNKKDSLLNISSAAYKVTSFSPGFISMYVLKTGKKLFLINNERGIITTY
ncbi:hypothetical protein GCM10011425_02940 [Mucilaginibacter galii]|uniref:Uncharacterized protein n=1 Tax=Mucilaginibacter galii TaxID=2005073 RepID=A0A917J6Y4_9SPHI|nr:hypothetical protein GCM10011425_02940 [Mucilaginibacter galii]